MSAAPRRHALLVPDMPTRQELAPYLERIDAARWYSNFGPLVRELEARLAALLPAPAGVATRVATVANATLGLELALLSLGLPPGARVLVPALTFVASAASIVRAGLAPVICDVDPASWMLTPGIARPLVARHGVAAVMPVSTFGCPQDPGDWDRFAAEAGVPVVIDAAGAYGNQAVAARALTVFSMHATKTFAAGEGGFVAGGDAGRIEQVRSLTNFGIVPGGLVNVPGTNAKLSEYHAAAGLAALDGWDARRRRRLEVHRRYLERLARDCPGVRLQARPPEGVYAILPVLLPEGRDAGAVAEALAARGVETRRWYCPTLERHPAFAGCAIAGELAVARALNGRLLALPFHAFMGEAEVAEVCGALAAALA